MKNNTKMRSLTSVIMPAYNVENYISKSIESVINQSTKNWELIIINDGSTDNTIESINKFLPNHKIHVISTQNNGVSTARNIGLKHAQGEFICFLDADDIYAPYYIEHMSQELNKGADIALCKYQEINNGVIISQSPEAIRENYDESFIDLVISNPEKTLVANMAAMYKKTLLNKYNILFQPNCIYAEDLEFILKCTSVAKKVALIPEFLYLYTVREGSASRNGYTYKKFFDEIDALFRVISFVENNDVEEKNKYINYAKNKIISVKNRVKRKPWREIKEGYFSEVTAFLNLYEEKYGESFDIPLSEIDSKKFWLKIKIVKSKNKFLWILASKI